MRIFSIALLALFLTSCGRPSPNAWYNSSLTQGPHSPTTDVGNAPSLCEKLLENSPIKELSIVDIATTLHGGNYKKQEFESTADYEHRMVPRLEKVKQLIQKKTDTDRLVFTVPIPTDKTQYNADTEIMTIGRKYSGLLDTHYSSAGYVIVAKSSERAVGTYVGVNAFGVKKQIVRTLGYAIGFNAPESSLGGWPSTLGSNAFKPIRIRMTRDEAKKAKTELAVLFAGQLKPPYLLTSKDRFTPKIDAPYDRTTVTEAVQLDINCAAIYNRANGKILRNISLTRSNRF